MSGDSSISSRELSFSVSRAAIAALAPLADPLSEESTSMARSAKCGSLSLIQRMMISDAFAFGDSPQQRYEPPRGVFIENRSHCGLVVRKITHELAHPPLNSGV